MNDAHLQCHEKVCASWTWLWLWWILFNLLLISRFLLIGAARYRKFVQYFMWVRCVVKLNQVPLFSPNVTLFSAHLTMKFSLKLILFYWINDFCCPPRTFESWNASALQNVKVEVFGKELGQSRPWQCGKKTTGDACFHKRHNHLLSSGGVFCFHTLYCPSVNVRVVWKLNFTFIEWS